MPVLASALALVGLGCAALSRNPNAAELALERTQLVQVSEALHAAQPAVARELTAARALWPLVSAGLPPSPSYRLRTLLATASARAGELPQPSFMADVKRLTGPASGLASLWEDYTRLTERGSTLTQATIGWVLHGPSARASYGRASAALYIDAIYDAHYYLSLIGKDVVDAYQRLGGERGFGTRLTQAKISGLASAYSIPAVRLVPHPGRSIESP